MRIAEIIEYTEVEGPGIRSAIWFQGCTINCPECCNQSFLPINGGTNHEPEKLAEYISKLNIEGVTILGGEPLQQPEELIIFLQHLKKISQFSIMLFTGYTWEIINKKPLLKQATALTDLVVAGPFIKKLSPDNRRWIGSSNQTIHFISDRYHYLKNNWETYRKEIEFHIKNGELLINGMPVDSGII